MADVELAIVVDKKGDGADAVARDLRQAARAADDLGDELARVDRRLAETAVLMRAAGKEFLATGNISPLRGLLKDERQLKTVQRSLQDTRKETDLLTEALTDTSAVIGRGLTKLATQPELLAAGGLAGVALGTVLAATAVGAVEAGLGGAALAGGIFVAARSSAVQAAWKSFGEGALEGLTESTVLLEKPAIDAAQKFGGLFQDTLQPMFGRVFDTLAPTLEHLTDGIVGLFQNMAPGLEHALEASGAVLDEFADRLPELGSAMSSFFDSMAAGAAGGADALATTISGLSASVVYLGQVLNAGAVAYELFGAGALGALSGMNGFEASLTLISPGVLNLTGHLLESKSAMDGLLTVFDKPGAVIFGGALISAAAAAQKHRIETDQAAASSNAFSQYLEHAQAELQMEAAAALDASLAMDKMTNSMQGLNQMHLSLDQATLQLQQGFIGLKGSVDGNSRSLDAGSAAGNKNAQALLNVVGEADRVRTAQINAGAGVDQANASFDSQIGTLQATAYKLGFTRSEVDSLIGRYRAVPGDVHTAIRGDASSAVAAAQEALGWINSVNGRSATTYIRTVFLTEGTPPGPSAGVRYAQAEGGIVAAQRGMIARSPTVLFGERGTGLEAYIPKRGISDARGLGLADAAARWHGGRVVPYGAGGGGGITVNGGITIVANDTKEAADKFLTYVAKRIRRDPATAAVFGR